MTENKNLNAILGKVVEETLKSKRGKKANGTKLGTREVNIPAKFIPLFSY